jgi:hypothetical protein
MFIVKGMALDGGRPGRTFCWPGDTGGLFA